MRASLVLAVLLLAPVTPASAEPTFPFGRWRTTPQRCSISAAPLGDGPLDCSAVQLHQQLPGQISIRFITGSDAEGISHQMTFVGRLPDATAALNCSGGQCRPDDRDHLAVVSSLSHGRFDERGIPLSLPSGWPATGQCTLSGGQARCESTTFLGDLWQGSAEF
ncbi:hypothetical protein EVJ50_07810 [Synechococcus sp. RSCCF101]|uniref:hypothetical protein n=1 Tax=Synechococcus sp. RSCCF101 TaxID=2511069 RepID=UPI0012492D3B|nr:hypothetical protein [Synechococcus sp. RSCCF101]QEY32143.1 hypothetical protein EVJ50_07810 [Synechococcus sp. RSCCF101]